MPFQIVVPELSESVVEATVSEWLKNEGDPVEAGDVVVVLETDKVSVEVTAEQAGVLKEITRGVDEDVTAGEVLGVIEESAEGGAPASSDDEDTKAAEQPEREAPEQPAGETREATEKPDGETRATPVARRYAEAHDVNIAEVTASGDKITKTDVQTYIDRQKAPAAEQKPEQTPSKRPVESGAQRAPTAPAPSMNGSGREERVRMSRRRRTIAQRLVEAQQTAAMLTTFNEIDMSAVVDMRARRKEAFKEKMGVSLGFSSFFVKATIGALKEFPYLNAEIQENEIVLKHYYDIGIAIGAEEGLVVPVLRGADRMSFAEIEKQIKDYAQQVQDGTLPIEALRGGTFTITNGGVFGSMMSTPILNPPQVGILGLHAIKDRAVVIDGEMVVRPMMYVALSYDHRIVDGREAVQFLVRVKQLVEDPESLLIEG